MMQEEFEERIGFKVSNQVYHDVIEPMYLGSSMLNKNIFCKMFNKSFLKRVAGVGLTKGCIVSVFNGNADNVHAVVKYGVYSGKHLEDGRYVFEVERLHKDIVKEAVDFGRQFPQILPLYALDIGMNSKVRWIAGGKDYD